MWENHYDLIECFRPISAISLQKSCLKVKCSYLSFAHKNASKNTTILVFLLARKVLFIQIYPVVLVQRFFKHLNFFGAHGTYQFFEPGGTGFSDETTLICQTIWMEKFACNFKIVAKSNVALPQLSIDPSFMQNYYNKGLIKNDLSSDARPNYIIFILQYTT